MSLPPLDVDLVRLRGLLEDLPVVELETAAGDGTTKDYYLGNPPALAAPALIVSAGGTTLVEGVGFVVSAERDRITLTAAPGAGVMVTMRYRRQTWPDAELLVFLADAASDWPPGVGRTYRAAVFAVDTLLIGTATALKFGAGAEEFDPTSVHDRLERLRAMFAGELSRQAARPAVLAPVDPPAAA